MLDRYLLAGDEMNSHTTYCSLGVQHISIELGKLIARVIKTALEDWKLVSIGG